MDELSIGDQELQELARAQVAGRSDGAPPPAQFMVEAMYDEKRTQETGSPKYVDRELIEIRVGRDTIRRPVTEQDKRVYAAQYLAFKREESQEAVEGFPLAQWAMIPGKAVVKEFAHYGIRTVEQLAAATDSTIQAIGPHLNLRQKARDWVEQAKKTAPLAALRTENDGLKSRVEALERMVQRQSQEIESARNNGGSLPAKVDDGRMAALEAKLAALLEAKPIPVAPPIQAVEQPPAVNGVKLNKDGTPRKKPGPKPKAQE